MHLLKLSIRHFKNLEQLNLEFSPKINCFLGNNGTGKTNLLDAVYYLSLTKSYFNPIDSQNIKHGKGFFVLQGEYKRNSITENIYCGVRHGKRKQFKRNKKEYRKFSEHVGLLPVVMISPADSSLILEGSEERRRFMDTVISQYDPEYLENLIRYNRALVQRNTLLKDFYRKGRFQPELLGIWDDQLINLGVYIHQRRFKFINQFLPIFQTYYSTVSQDKEKVQLLYQSQLSETSFQDLLSSAIDRDRLFQFTTVGIHKDDLILNLEGHSIKRTGSQGQQKTYLVSLKLAKFEFIKHLNGFPPILLLDDIFDKFDALRVKQIIHLVAENQFGQIFITDTSKDRIKLVLQDITTDYKLFNVDNGKVKEV